VPGTQTVLNDGTWLKTGVLIQAPPNVHTNPAQSKNQTKQKTPANRKQIRFTEVPLQSFPLFVFVFYFIRIPGLGRPLKFFRPKHLLRIRQSIVLLRINPFVGKLLRMSFCHTEISPFKVINNFLQIFYPDEIHINIMSRDGALTH
jgi:hypothetical protein